MQKFDVFFGYVAYHDVNDGKSRPVIFVEISDDDKFVNIFPVYSYKKWFVEKGFIKTLVEISDIQSAGLDRRSFIDISRGFALPKSSFSNFKKIGHLSQNDIKRLTERVEV